MKIKPDRAGLHAGSSAPARSCAEARPRGSPAGAISYQNAGECLTFESPSARLVGFRPVARSPNGHKRLDNLPWVRDESTAFAIVDGDVDTRRILQRILEQSGGYLCVGSYAQGEDALREIPALHPRIVLMEVQTPGLSGIEWMRRLKDRLPGLIVVLVSEATDAATMSAALAAGGDGYLTKPFGVAQCLATIRFSVRPDRSAPLETDTVQWCTRRTGERTRLTEREQQVMSCLAKGLLYKEIADELRLSFSMVHKLQHRIFLKLRVNNRTEAVTQWRYGHGA